MWEEEEEKERKRRRRGRRGEERDGKQKSKCVEEAPLGMPKESRRTKGRMRLEEEEEWFNTLLSSSAPKTLGDTSASKNGERFFLGVGV